MAPQTTQIGGGFTEGELKLASFWVRNGVALRRAGRTALLVVNALLWGYSLWGVLDAYAISYPRESKFTAEIARNQVTMNALEADRPRNVSVGAVSVLEGTDGRFDMVVDAQNDNERWWADFAYHFVLSGEDTPQRTGFILPQHRTVITELGYKPKTRGGAVAQLVVDDIRWHRLDPKQVPGRYGEFENEHFNVAFENIQYTSDIALDTRTVSRTSFDVINRGAFGYWSIDLVIRLYRASALVAVNKVNVANLVPGETRRMDIDWFERLPNVNKTEIVPIVNFVDPQSYLPTDRFRPNP